MKSNPLLYISAIVLGSLFLLSFIVDLAVEGVIESYGSDITKSEVEVGSVSISALSGNMEIEDLVLYNPKGFKSKYLFKLDSIEVDLNILSTLSPKVVISKIYIEKPSIIYEVNASGSNIGKIKENIANYSSGNNSSTEPERKTTSQKSNKRVVIRDLLVEEGKVSLASRIIRNGEPPAYYKLPDIHMKNLGEGGGTSLSLVINKLIAEINKSIMKISGDGVGKALEDAKDILDGLGNKFKSLF